VNPSGRRRGPEHPKADPTRGPDQRGRARWSARAGKLLDALRRREEPKDESGFRRSWQQSTVPRAPAPRCRASPSAPSLAGVSPTAARFSSFKGDGASRPRRFRTNPGDQRLLVHLAKVLILSRVILVAESCLRPAGRRLDCDSRAKASAEPGAPALRPSGAAARRAPPLLRSRPRARAARRRRFPAPPFRRERAGDIAGDACSSHCDRLELAASAEPALALGWLCHSSIVPPVPDSPLEASGIGSSYDLLRARFRGNGLSI
jgi:hypothetical protein